MGLRLGGSTVAVTAHSDNSSLLCCLLFCMLRCLCSVWHVVHAYMCMLLCYTCCCGVCYVTAVLGGLWH